MSYLKNDVFLGRALREYGEWAQGELNLLLDLIDVGNTVIDVGAFVGTHTIAFARHVGHKGQVYAFEPHPVAFGLLRLNVEQNDLSNVKLFNAALSDYTGTMNSHKANLADTDSPGSFSLLTKVDVAAESSGITIDVMTLDQFDIDSCHLMKVDVEGMELNVLKGSAKTLRRLHPLVFAECLSLHNGWQTVSFMRDNGFEAFLHNERAFNPDNFKRNASNFFGDARETNIVFVPTNQLSDFRERCKYFESLIPLKTLDDLALGMLKKPQYKYEALAQTRAAQILGIDFLANELELKQLADTASRLETSLQEKVAQIAELETSIQAKDALIAELKPSLQEKVSGVAKLETSLQEKVSHIAELEASLQEKVSDVANLEASLQEKISDIADLEISFQEKDAHIANLEASLQEKVSQISSLEAQIQQIQRGIVMQLVNRYQRAVEKLLRPHTRRRHYYELVLSGIRVILNEGWKSFFRKVKAHLRGKRDILKKLLLIGTKMHYYYRLVLTGIRVIRNEGWRSFWSKFKGWLRRRMAERKRVKPPTPTADMADDWSDYWVLSQKITEVKKRKLESYKPKPPQMISIPEGKLAAHAKSLQFPAVQNPQVSIVIPVYNKDKLTIECLTSVLVHTKDISYEIIVIDDGSAKKTKDALSQIQNITYLRNPENLGFLLSCNCAAEKARGEFLLILNNDVQVTEGWLSPLVKTFSKYENVGAVGPKILYLDGRLQEAGARIKPDASSQLIGHLDNPELPQYNYIREVEYCSSVCLLTETEVFRKLGGFDSDFAPAYCEDSDLCFRLRKLGKRIFYDHGSVVIHYPDATVKVNSAHKRQLAVRNQQKLAEKWQERIDALNQVRLIAFYLPQYHPIPENDRWWGKGFTEWTNVARARPNFVGHYQPHLPSDLGFYDLQLEEIMDQQAELAKRYGIYGFCFYYYWFSGKRLLEMPLERMLKTGKPYIPFCLCWANDNWTRSWVHGSESHVLIAQQHSDEDDRAVIMDIMRYMRQPNYIRINGKPLFLVYRADLFPNMKRTIQTWRDLCCKEGIGDIYLAMVESFEPFIHHIKTTHLSRYGFDASVECPPHMMFAPIKPPGTLLNPDYKGAVHDYREVVLRFVQREKPGRIRFRAVSPGWDDTPRRPDDSNILIYSTPGSYQAWLEAILDLTLEKNFGDERIVFINAWNEWAEGMYLEPDQHFGHGFLEAMRNALERPLLNTD